MSDQKKTSKAKRASSVKKKAVSGHSVPAGGATTRGRAALGSQPLTTAEASAARNEPQRTYTGVRAKAAEAPDSDFYAGVNV